MDRVLLGAIFRKLPLKLLLVLLAIFGLLFACTKADLQVIDTYDIDLNGQYHYSNSNGDFVCVVVNSCTTYGSNGVAEFTVSNTPNWDMIVKFNGQVNNTPNMDKGMGYCGDEYIDITTWYNCNLTFKTYKAVDYTSSQCQSEYNLIPINEVDAAYCESNNLCSSSGSPSDCPNVGVSNLWINDVFHPGAFNIIMNIPEEIDWDYAYTNSGSSMNIDVVGYNQDAEYINGLIDINNYKPTSSDFSKVFGLFDNYGGLLVACLFIILIFYFVKKLFK